MSAVMVRFYASGWVRGVDVKGIEMGADLFNWREILYQ